MCQGRDDSSSDGTDSLYSLSLREGGREEGWRDGGGREGGRERRRREEGGKEGGRSEGGGL